MAGEFIARRPQIRPDPANQPLGPFGSGLTLRRGQPFLSAPGVSLPATTFPLLPGYVRIRTVEGVKRTIDVMTDGEPYLLPEGFAAGWENVTLPGRVSRRKWTGGAGLVQALPLTMNVLKRRGLNIDDEWAFLRHLARPPQGERPPAIRVSGPVDNPELEWVVIGFEPDASSTKRHGRKMVRQDVLVTLGQWSEITAKGTLKRTDPAKDKPRQVDVSYERRTLKALAKYYLNDAARWTEIAKLNKGLNDPTRQLPVGTQVQIPAR